MLLGYWLSMIKLKKISTKLIKKVFVEYNKIDIPNKNKKTRFEIKGSVNLVFVGRLIKGKSLLNILNALRRIKNVNLTVFGDGPQRNRIEQFISHYNLKKKSNY